MRIISILVLSAAVTSLASLAAAEPAAIRVPVSQSDLQSSHAVAALYERVEQAAEEVCRMSNRPLAVTRASCMREAVERAVARAELAPLSEYAATHESGHSAAVELASR
jgi:UrcA family protein